MIGSRKIMSAVGEFVVRFHRLIPLAGAVLFGLSLWSASGIAVKTQMKDMLSMDDPKVRSYQDIMDNFPGGNVLTLTVSGADRTAMARCADEIVAAVNRSDKTGGHIVAVETGMDRAFLDRWGLLLLDEAGIEDMGRMLAQPGIGPLFDALNGSLERGIEEGGADGISGREEREAAALLDRVEAALSLLGSAMDSGKGTDPRTAGRDLARTLAYGDRYSFSPDGDMLMFRVRLGFPVEDIGKTMDFMHALKPILQEVGARHAGLELGYTGDAAVNADEQDAMRFDMLIPTLLALGILLVLFVFSFRGLHSVLVMLGTLVAGIVYNYGIVGIVIGEINMITTIMAALLVGMGIDYGIQFTTGYTACREEGMDPARAVVRTYEMSGMGTLLAALATGSSFFVLAFSRTKMIAQFGLFAGLGILCCYLAMSFLLPALLLWFPRVGKSAPRLPRLDFSFLSAVGRACARHWRIVLAAAAVLTALLGLSASRIALEYDFTAMEPQHVTSIRTYKDILSKFGVSPLSALVAADTLEEARALAGSLEKEPAVAYVDSVASWIPSEPEQGKRLEAVRSLRSRKLPAARTGYGNVDVEALAAQIERLEANVIETADLSVVGLGEDNLIVRKRDLMIREIRGAETGRPGREAFRAAAAAVRSGPAAAAPRLEELDAAFRGEARTILAAMTAVERPIAPEDLPEPMTAGMRDREGRRWLLTISPAGSAVADAASIRAFNDRLQKVCPEATGFVPLSIAMMDELLSEAWKASLAILAVILLSMGLGFRSVRYSLLAVVPLALGVVWMFGLIPIAGVELSGFTVAMVPIVIGIGVAYGTYMVQRYLAESRDLEAVLRTTGTAVFLSAVTTMVGFGSLALVGSFRMIASFGIVLFLGITAAFTATITVLPALLAARIGGKS